VPLVYTVDPQACVFLTRGVCGKTFKCKEACPTNAIDFNQKEEFATVGVQAIVTATGFDVFDPIRRPELGYGNYPQVITTLEFERLASASGPTSGKIILDGHVPRRVVFIQCVGSRDLSLGLPNCSRVCCMAVAKQAHLAHDRLPGAQITVFYMDVRSYGKGFEEFYDRVREEGVTYRRGNPAEIIRRGDQVVVRAEDTLLGEPVEVEADLIVLAVGMLPRQDAGSMAQVLDIDIDEDGFYREEHPNLKTVESGVPGIFLAGSCQGPKDIPDTVAHAKAAASAAMIWLTRDQ
jgi:heterodisulfide reductase subunit A